MIFRQITHDDLGCASYLVGDSTAGVAVVVDPRFEIDIYLDLARYMNVRIEHILETHNHADHVSGHGRLAAATGATIHVHRLAEPEYDHEPFDDGWELAVGDLVIRALHTPGHRPEHTAFALIDGNRGPEPWALLSGDTLFVGDVARPDLAVDKSEGARGIFTSLQSILALPSECEVWPGHLGGSMCGGPGMDMKVSSTIGYERAHNPILSETDQDSFVEQSIAKLGPQPPNFQAIVALNRGPLLTSGVEPLPLTPRQVEVKQSEGALLVDVRTDRQFDDAHIPGALCITKLNAGFGSKLAWVADREQDIILVGRDDEDAREASKLATAVGIRRIAGFLHGGMTSWREEGRPVGRIERVTVDELHERLDADPELQILDVRAQGEWDAGHIPGSVHVPYHDVTEVPEAFDPARPIAAICGSGQRASLAASLLALHGAATVLHVTPFGVPAWGRAGYALDVEEASVAAAS
ncbi:MBL fold metallo-hydrolase [Paraconexibacter antarcticus]|uniref:MBL fold metallo-hydrolase n=1 Tax=Paraconexibacter antarcticus TaxID=2949664 RepID=A0ABY5DYX7_9ACTN|nr:MBL fold metallo-hydrolase [Paraconexibacter antarcticus]UTI66896.1 MBL fold metallo-hydrolase [Paraconexibacter antarcticus]